jgi:hypothetical protein
VDGRGEQDRYAYRPLLWEAVVGLGRFVGACYRLANWMALGQRQGRGRVDCHYSDTGGRAKRDRYTRGS